MEDRNQAENQEDRVCETDLDRESKWRFFLEVIDDCLDERNHDGCEKAKGIPHQTRREAQSCSQPDHQLRFLGMSRKFLKRGIFMTLPLKSESVPRGLS
jgi:hypothetical protein